MQAYEKVGWLDHVVDVATNEVIQEGTPLSQTNLGHMDDGIEKVTAETIIHAALIADTQKEIKVLKDATLNNMTQNTVDSVAITSGIYDPVARKIYV